MAGAWEQDMNLPQSSTSSSGDGETAVRRRDGAGAGCVGQASKGKKAAESWGEILREWPKTTVCIVSNEFCERFSYYGMRTVLTLYLLNVLKFSEDTSTMLFNGFTVLCYFTPILGSILADGYIGKFKTIFFVSILYTCGQIVLALVSTQNSASSLHPWVDILGLAIIGFGTGGIKPCVCSFGGDQFEPHQENMISLFFSAFYFSINAGSMISTFISPMFRATPCLGQDSCYPMAFGIPAALMVVATLVFMAGSFWYKKPPPKENIFGEVYAVGKRAARNKWRSDLRDKHSHWLDYYFDTHLCTYDQRCGELQRQTGNPHACHKRQFVADVKSLLRILVMYLPAPMFWALYDQQGSRWLIQSVMMDCRLWGDTLLLPDQMQTLNAVLILLFIPIFQFIIYPAVSCCVKLTPLRKMVAGGFVAALAFVISAAVQFQVNTTLPDTPHTGHAFMSAMNTFDNCSLSVCTNGADNKDFCHTLAPNRTLTNTDREHREMFDVEAGKRNWVVKVVGESAECNVGGKKAMESKWQLEAGKTYYMMLGQRGALFALASTKKSTEGMGEFSVGFTLALNDLDYSGNLALCRRPRAEADRQQKPQHPCNPRQAEDFYAWQVDDGDLTGTGHFQSADGTKGRNATFYKYKSVRAGSWELYLMEETPKKLGEQTMDGDQLHLTETGVQLDIAAQGGVYMVALTGETETAQKRVFQVVPDNSVSILWQVPQIAVITAAEIMFSITGYEFAYSQAAPSMKSLVQALWLLTTALGDAIILVITLIKFPNLAIEFLFYAAMMVVVIIILALLAIFYYEYNYYTGESHSNTDGRSDRCEVEEWTPMGGRKTDSVVQMYGTDDTGGTENWAFDAGEKQKSPPRS